MHGERLAWTAKMLSTNLKKSQEDEDYPMVLQWQEALRKMTNSCVDIAKTVLGVEELVKGKTVIRA